MEPEKNEISVDFFLATQDFDSTIFLLLLFFVSLSFSFFYTLRHMYTTNTLLDRENNWTQNGDKKTVM